METVPALVKFLESGEDDNGSTTETTISRPASTTTGFSIYNRRPGFRLLNKALTLTTTITPTTDNIDDHPAPSQDIEAQDISEEFTTESSTSSIPVTSNFAKFRRPFVKSLTKFQTHTSTTPRNLLTKDNEPAVDITSGSTTSVLPTKSGSTKYRRPFLKPPTKFQTLRAVSTTETPIDKEPITSSTTENLLSKVTKAGGDATAHTESSTARFEPNRKNISKLRQPIFKTFRKVSTTPITTTTEMATTTETDAVTTTFDNYNEQTRKEVPLIGDKDTSQMGGSEEVPLGTQVTTPIKPPSDLRRYKVIKRPSKNATVALVNRTVTESDITLTPEDTNDDFVGELGNLQTSTPKTQIMTAVLKKLPKFKLPALSLSRKHAVVASKDTITPDINLDNVTKATVPEISQEPEHTTRKYSQLRFPSFKFGKGTITSTKRGESNQESDITTVKYGPLSQDSFRNVPDNKYNENPTEKMVATAHKTKEKGAEKQEEMNQDNEGSINGKQRITIESGRDEGYLTNRKENVTSGSSIHNETYTLDESDNINTPRARTLFSNKKLKDTISSSLSRKNSSIIRPATPYPALENKLRNITLKSLRNDPLGLKADKLMKNEQNLRKVENSRFFVSATTTDGHQQNTFYEAFHKNVTKDMVVLRMNIKPVHLSNDSTREESEGFEHSGPIKEVLEIAELNSRHPTPTLKIGETTNKTSAALYDPLVYDNGSDHRLRLQLRPREDMQNKLPSKIVVTIQHLNPTKDTEESQHTLVPILDVSENGDLEYRTDKIKVTVQVSDFKENDVDRFCKACNNETTFHLSFSDNMADNSSAVTDAQERSEYQQTSVQDASHDTSNKDSGSSVESSRKDHATEIITEAIVHNPPAIATTQVTTTESAPTLYVSNIETSDSFIQSMHDDMEHTTPADPEVASFSAKHSESSTAIETSTEVPITEMFSTQTTADYDYMERGSTTEILTTEQYTTVGIISETKGNGRSETSVDTDQYNDMFPENVLKELYNQISSEIPEIKESFVEVDKDYNFSTTEYITESSEILGTSLAPMNKGTDSTNDDQYPFTYQPTTESAEMTDVSIQGMIYSDSHSFSSLAEISPTERNSLTNQQTSFYFTTEEAMITSTLTENLVREFGRNGEMPKTGDTDKADKVENKEFAVNIVTEMPSIENTDSPVFENAAYYEVTTEIERTTFAGNEENESGTERYGVTSDMRPILYNDSTSENFSDNFVSPTEETVTQKIHWKDYTEIGSQEFTTEDSESTMEYVVTTTESSDAFHRFVLGDDMAELGLKNEPETGEDGSEGNSDESDELNNDVFGTEDTTTEAFESFTKVDWAADADNQSLKFQRENSSIADAAVSTVDSVETLNATVTTLKPLETFE